METRTTDNAYHLSWFDASFFPSEDEFTIIGISKPSKCDFPDSMVSQFRIRTLGRMPMNKGQVLQFTAKELKPIFTPTSFFAKAWSGSRKVGDQRWWPSISMVH
jgi:hypothetical protein